MPSDLYPPISARPYEHQLHQLLCSLRCMVPGQTKLVLEVDGPALIPVTKAYNTDAPEQLAAKAEAKAWAQELREGVAASLGLEAGMLCPL